MTLKGLIDPDHIPVNKYELAVVGLPTIQFTSLSGMEIDVGTIELPDRTKASGGQLNTSQLTVQVPMHHTAQIAAMELWFQGGQDPIVITYKKACTLTHLSGSGEIKRAYSMLGTWISKRKLPDLAFDNAGEMSVVEYTLEVDSIIPLP